MMVKNVLVKTIWALLALGFCTQVAHSEIYKWTDADGSIQYGDDPPKGVKTQKVSGGVTVVPAAVIVKNNPVDTAQSGVGKESAEKPAQKSTSATGGTNSAADARQKAIAQCEKNRGVDCEDEATAQVVSPKTVYVPVPGWSQPPLVPRNKNDQDSSGRTHKPTPSQSAPSGGMAKLHSAAQSTPMMK